MASDRRRSRGRWRSEDGNTLILMPASVIIVLLLAGVAVDSAVVFRAQRSLEDLAAGIANDAAAAIDVDSFYGSTDAPEVTLDGSRVQTLIDLREPTAGTVDASCTWMPGPDGADPTIQITCTGVADRIFFDGLLGGGPQPVRASAEATLVTVTQ